MRPFSLSRKRCKEKYTAFYYGQNHLGVRQSARYLFCACGMGLPRNRQWPLYVASTGGLTVKHGAHGVHGAAVWTKYALSMGAKEQVCQPGRAHVPNLIDQHM